MPHHATAALLDANPLASRVRCSTKNTDRMAKLGVEDEVNPAIRTNPMEPGDKAKHNYRGEPGQDFINQKM
jgi:hypothetical protein